MKININDIVFLKKEIDYKTGKIEKYPASKSLQVKVASVKGDTFTFFDNNKEYSLNISCIESRSTLNDGYNPFLNLTELSFISTSLESLLIKMGVGINTKTRETFYSNDCDRYGFKTMKVSFNPIVFLNNKPFEYQRDNVWSLENKQDLIESMYNECNIGSFIFVERSFEDVERLSPIYPKNIGWFDILDGKQRLTTLIEFAMSKFPDKNGKYFEDFSSASMMKFKNYRVQYCKIENATDESILETFIRTNTAGVVMDKNHIEKVKNKLNEQSN